MNELTCAACGEPIEGEAVDVTDGTVDDGVFYPTTSATYHLACYDRTIK